MINDITERKITKIAREAEKFTVRSLKLEGLGTAEIDFIHAVRHAPGSTQAEIRRLLNIDKGAAARRVSSLEAKGYLVQRSDPEDGRCRLLYATAKADSLKNTKSSIETLFYAWLTEELTEAEAAAFAGTLNRLYIRSKTESRSGFTTLTERLDNTEKEENG